MNPARVLVLGFAGAVTAGTLLLMLPAAAAPGVTITWVDALFTAVSAVCVTGLTVLPTADAWSPVGHAVILALVQVGGLGIMTVTALASLLLGRRITLRERLVIRQALQEPDLAGLVRLLRSTAVAVLTIESVGALLLTARFLPELAWPRALWYGVFHAVSAFNNAGFDLFGTSLAGFSEDGYLLAVVAVLALLGGFGFHVLMELGRWIRRHQRTPWSLHTRVVLTATAILVLSGGALMLLLEWNNPDTLRPLAPGAKIANAFFTASAARTAGFSSVDIAAFTPAALLLLMALMLVGGAPGSTAGGVKVTTVAVLLAMVGATLRGQDDPVLFGRRLPRDQTDRSLALLVIALVVLFAATMLFLLLEGGSLLTAVFQTLSALSTVGLSTVDPAQHGAAGRVLLALSMFVGRVGPLTLVYALASRRRRQVFRYPEDRLPVG